MSVTVDDRKRVVLPGAKPGEEFDVQVSGQGVFILRRLEPVKLKGPRPAKLLRFEKRGRFTVAVLDRPIDERALKEALADFPP